MIKIYKASLAIVTITLIFFAASATIQTAFALYFAQYSAEQPSADLAVVFPGSAGRIAHGIQLLAEKKTKHLLILNSKDRWLKRLAKKHRLPQSSFIQPAAKSRSTFEDVYQSLAIVKKLQPHSIILVTSSYHMPRAAFLFQIFMRLNGMHAVYSYAPINDRLAKRSTGKMLYNETIELWGSIAEMTTYYFTHTFLLDSPTFIKVHSFIKNNFLFASPHKPE